MGNSGVQYSPVDVQHRLRNAIFNLFTHFVVTVSPTRTVPIDLIMYKINLYTFSNAKKTYFRKNPSFFQVLF